MTRSLESPGRRFPSFLLSAQPPRLVCWRAIGLMIAVLGLVDFWTGFEVSFAFFYLIPVSFAAWTVGRNAAFAVSLISAAVWQIANYIAGEQFSNALIPFWNAATRLGFFFTVSWLASIVRAYLQYEASLARTDFLTGLLNGRAFYAAAEAELERARRYPQVLTFVYIDLDDFKRVNDLLSHSVGDELLRAVGTVMAGMVRKTDAAARLGGDEFTVLLPETDAAAARVFVSRLREALLGKMEERGWQVTFSIGVLTSRGDAGGVAQLIRMSDELMYEVKREGKNAVRYLEAA